MGWISDIAGEVGSWFGGDSEEDRVNRQMQEQAKYAKAGIRWKVADAKAAGLHPLFALGGNTATYSPVASQVSDGARGIGSALGSAFEEYRERRRKDKSGESDMETRVRRDQAEIIAQEAEQAKEATKRSYVDTAMQAHEFNRMKQEAINNKDRTSKGASDEIEHIPDQVVSHRGGTPWLSAGRKPFWTQYQVEDGLDVYLPWSNEGPAESMEIGLAGQAAIIAYNVAKQGPDWVKRAKQYWPQWDWTLYLK